MKKLKRPLQKADFWRQTFINENTTKPSRKLLEGFSCPIAVRAEPAIAFAVILSFLLMTTSTPAKAQEQAEPGLGELQAMTVLRAIEQATVNAVEKCDQTVVAIARVSRNRQQTSRLPGLSFNFQTDESEASKADYVPKLFGSGVVVSEDGLILTCAHVLGKPNASDYFVWLDRKSYPARVVSRPAKVLASDPFSDLAILKIEAEGLIPIEFSNSTDLRKGQFVLALGNPYAIARDGRASASWGIISNLKRFAPRLKTVSRDQPKESLPEMGTLIQTDVKLSTGFSGGALIDLDGKMIGLTTSLAAASGFEKSAGFALAVDSTFLRVVETLKRGEMPTYGFLGIQPEDVDGLLRARGIRGARVTAVIAGMPGDEAGLRPRDVIFQVGNVTVSNRNDLYRELSSAAANEQVELKVQRFRVGRQQPDILTVPVTLSKKFVPEGPTSFASSSPQPWLGLEVEYATAMPSEIARSTSWNDRRAAPKVSALRVEPDTLAWGAGLRPGYGILAVNGRAVETPAEFYAAVRDAKIAEPVALAVLMLDGRKTTLRITPPAVAADAD